MSNQPKAKTSQKWLIASAIVAICAFALKRDTQKPKE